MKRYVVEVQEGENGESILPLPEEMLQEAGWKEGDTIVWKDNKDGTWSMTKKQTGRQFVLVETVSMFRERYVLEVPEGKSDWALDTVAMEEAKEFSQEHLAENIVSHRVISEDEVISLFEIDNAYLRSMSRDEILSKFVTKINEKGDLEK